MPGPDLVDRGKEQVRPSGQAKAGVRKLTNALSVLDGGGSNDTLTVRGTAGLDAVLRPSADGTTGVATLAGRQLNLARFETADFSNLASLTYITPAANDDHVKIEFAHETTPPRTRARSCTSASRSYVRGSMRS